MSAVSRCGIIILVLLLAACGGGGAPAIQAPADPPPEPPALQLLVPVEGQDLDGTTLPLRWAAVEGAETYTLHVGTAPGSNNVLDSGELPADRLQHFLPSTTLREQTLFARLFARVDGRWHGGTVVSFRVRSVSGGWQRPLQVERIRQIEGDFRWQHRSDATAYYLWVGETLGGNEVLDSGELPPTADSHAMPDDPLPRERDLYARLWRRLADGRWVFDEDLKFQVVAEPGEMIHPSWNDRLHQEELTRAFRWAPIPGAERYYLYVGTAPGLQDVGGSGELPASRTQHLPVLRHYPAQTLYARLYHYRNGAWHFGADHPFVFQPSVATLLSPNVNARVPAGPLLVQWRQVPLASGYRAIAGTHPGGADIFSSGELPASTDSIQLPALPPQTSVYLRVQSLVGGQWRHFGDGVVHAGFGEPQIIPLPVDGDSGVIDLARPVEWEAVPGAEHYRVRIGSIPGAEDLYFADRLPVNRRFVSGLVPGSLVHLTIGARVDGQWHERGFERRVVDSNIRQAEMLRVAELLTTETREMATADNTTRPGTILARLTSAAYSDCGNYSSALIDLIRGASEDSVVRRRDTCLLNNQTECHTMVELWNPARSQWEILDPTFTVAPVHRSSGNRLSVEDLEAMVRTGRTDELDMRALADRSWEALNNYYLDYLVLFAQPAAPEGAPPAQERSVIDLFDLVEPEELTTGHYALQCPPDAGTVSALADGIEVDLPCTGVDRLTPVFRASSIEPIPGETLASIFVPRRFFMWPRN
jgi:hypothetical protein